MKNKRSIIVEEPDARDESAVEPPRGSVVVRCLNPTVNKPLHVGHLRNASIGMAISASLNAVGVPAVRHCLLEDIGRFMAEAVVSFKGSGGGIPDGQKTDHYIGRCYRAYRLGNLSMPKPSGLLSNGDVADEFLQKRKLGDAETTRLFREVADLAVKGQGETLQKLGIVFDYCDLESGEDPYLSEFITRGCRRGIFVDNYNGKLVVIGPGNRVIDLANKFGHGNEKLYLLSFLYRTFTGPHDNERTIAVAGGGGEWKKVLPAFPRILGGLGVKSPEAFYEPVFTGLVTLDGKKVASRSGHGDLVDDVFDELANTTVANSIATSSTAPVEQAAAVALRLFFLSFPRTSYMEFDQKSLAGDPDHPAWAITRVWSETRDRPAGVSDGDDDPLMNKACEILADASNRRSFERVVDFLTELALPGRNTGRREVRFRTLRFTLSGLGIGSFPSGADPFPLNRSLLFSEKSAPFESMGRER